MTQLQQQHLILLLNFAHLSLPICYHRNKHAAVVQGDAAMAKGPPSTSPAADRPSQPGARMAGRPALSHVLHCQPQDCSPGTTLLLT